MAYTKYSLTPANNNAAPPDGAPEGMLPSAVNDTMRDMMAQIRDVGDGIRGGTYTMTAPVITGGSITGVALSGNTLTNPVITGGSINNTTVGATTRSTGAFTTLASNGATTFTAGTASTSTTTGTAVITGGLGVSGRINAANFDGIVGANTAAAGNFTTLGATGVATFSAGTVSAPAITTTGDTNTGIFFPAADTIAFTEGGVESMRIDSSGLVGIGTSSPSTFGARLNAITSSTTGYALFSQSPSSGGTIGNTSNMVYFADTRGNSNDGFKFYSRRFATGGTWENQTMRLERNVDGAQSCGIIEFGPLSLDFYGNNGAKALTVGSNGIAVNIASSSSTTANSRLTIFNSESDGAQTITNAGLLFANSNGWSQAGIFPIGGAGFSGALAFTTAASKGGSDFVTTERMRITAAGLVGIGTSSPANNLDVSSSGTTRIQATSTGTSLYPGFVVKSGSALTFEFTQFSDGTGYIYNGANAPITFATNASERMRIDANGLVGIGTSAPTAKLDIIGPTGSVTAPSYLNQTSVSVRNNFHTRVALVNADPTIYESAISSYGASAAHPTQTLSFAPGPALVYSNGNGSTAPTEKFRIDSSGNLLVGTTVVRGKICNDFDGSATNGIALNDTASATGTSYAKFYINGSLIGSIDRVGATSAVIYNTTSDYRLKTVIAPVSDSGTRLDAVKPIEYDWNTGGRTRGFLAHQFAEVYPSSVTGEKDAVDAEGKPVYQAMQASSTEVMADLIAEIQSLRKRVAQLESK